LVISHQPFPEIILKGKQLGEEVLHVKLIRSAGVEIQSLSPVHAELITDHPQKKKTNATPPISFVDQSINPETGIAKFPLKFNKGSNGALVSIKFSARIHFVGQPLPVTIESPCSRQFIVIPNDSHWQISAEIILRKDSFLGNLEIPWSVCANTIQRHFLRATKQNPAMPERYLSKHDFQYFHNRFFSSSDPVSQNSFNKFWNYFGENLSLLRFSKHILKLWQTGLIYGFMDRTDINNALLSFANQTGAFIIRFSENYPGKLAIGFICDEGNIKHHLVEDLKSSSFSDWLSGRPEFEHVLQCIGFSEEGKKPIFKKIQKNLAFSPFLAQNQIRGDIKPGYDPLNNSWKQVVSDESLRRELKKARGLKRDSDSRPSL